jgi:hypothetical protein
MFDKRVYVPGKQMVQTSSPLTTSLNFPAKQSEHLAGSLQTWIRPVPQEEAVTSATATATNMVKMVVSMMVMLHAPGTAVCLQFIYKKADEKEKSEGEQKRGGVQGRKAIRIFIH